MKNNPTGVRFDKTKLAFLMEREKLSSPQQAVNFLIDAYWWQNKTTQQAHLNMEAPPPQEPKFNLYDAYNEEIIKTTYSGDLQKLMKEIESNGDLGAINKAKLRAIANEHRINFSN